MRFLKWLRSVIKAIVIAIMVVNVTTIFLGIFTRYVFKFAIGFTDELGAFSMVCITFLGAVWALIDDAHISFETLVEMTPPQVQRGIGVFNNLMGAMFALVLTYFGANLTILNWGVRAISMPISRGFVFSVVPVSGVLLCIVFLMRAARPWKTGREAQKAAHGGVDLEKEVI